MSEQVESRANWLIPAGLILLSLVPAIAGTVRLSELATNAPINPANARFFATPLPVVLHILTVIPYTIVGAFQFARGLRRRNRKWHRTAGKVLLVLGMTAALSGLWMAHFYPWPAGDGNALYIIRLIFGSAMVASLVLAVAAIRRRQYFEHGAWMTRAYAIGVGAGTQVFTHLPYAIVTGNGRPDETSRAVMMGAGWIINVIIAEWLIRKRAASLDPQPERRATLVADVE